MAQILSFRIRRVPIGEGTSRRAGDSAEVILFPGIRYERWNETGARRRRQQRQRRSSRTSRDVLELAE